MGAMSFANSEMSDALKQVLTRRRSALRDLQVSAAFRIGNRGVPGSQTGPGDTAFLGQQWQVEEHGLFDRRSDERCHESFPVFTLA